MTYDAAKVAELLSGGSRASIVAACTSLHRREVCRTDCRGRAAEGGRGTAGLAGVGEPATHIVLTSAGTLDSYSRARH